MDNGTRLLILTILEGRHFPLRQSVNIVIEAKFDGESLSSDPVTHVSNPSFSVELGWLIERRALHELHVKRSPLKLQAYAINSKTGSKESIGYIILDTRQAHDDIAKAKPTWTPLLNSKYHPRPELLMCLGLEKNVKPPVAKANPTQSLGFAAGVKSKSTDDELEVVLRDDGYYQIGSADTCKTAFMLSFTLGYAASLDNLVSETIDDEERSFFFYYSLLGNDIVTDKFRDVQLNDFSPERASIKILSSLPNLRTFFKQQDAIQVHLCSGERSLGSATIFVNDFIKPEVTLSSLPVKLEDCFELRTSRHSQVDTFSEDSKPMVGVSIFLRLETDRVNEVRRVEPTLLNSSVEIEKDVKRTHGTSPPQKLKKSPDKIASPLLVTEVPVRSSPLKPKRLDKTPEKKPESVPARSAWSEELQQLNHYEFTIELKSIKNLSDRPLYVTARYSWSYFGDVAPISSEPPVHVGSGGGEEDLPPSDTTVSFATKPAQLRDIFTRQSIPVDIVQREEVLGRGAIVLSHLINSIPSSVVNDNGDVVDRWTHSQTLVIDEGSKPGSGNRLCELRVALMLDNLGVMRPKDEEAQPTTERYLRRNVEVDPEVAERVALELERWKEMQEQVFKKELQEKERGAMEGLARAWTAKEAERESLFKRRLDEYGGLEEKLKAALDAVDKKERQLKAKEDEMERLKVDLQAEYDRLVQEVRDISRRVKEECAHKNELERSKAKALQEQCVKWQRQVVELENKLEVKEAEFASLKEHRDRPEIRLQSQINVLTIEKAELERRNEALVKSKGHYKNQYGKCLKELARLKQAMQMEAHAQLRERKKELNLMKIGLEQQAAAQNERRLGPSSSISAGPSEIPAVVSQSLVTLLLAERERLVDSGHYPPTDPVILQLDKEIRNASANINQGH